MIAVVHGISCGLCLVFGTIVRFAGDIEILANADYRPVSDPRAMHGWVGNRVPACAIALAIMTFLAWRLPEEARLVAMLAILAILLTGFVVLVGMSKFSTQP